MIQFECFYHSEEKGADTILKNANGYGSVFKLSGNRRRPWVARITVGWERDAENPDSMGKQKFKVLGYYKTRPDAVRALAEYNNEPYDLDANKITFEELFERWKENEYPVLSYDAKKTYNSAYLHCDSLKRLRFREIKPTHLQAAVQSCPKGFATKKKMKFLFGKLYKFAIDNDLASKNYASSVQLGKATKEKRIIFTKNELAEIKALAAEDDFYELVLILLYTGMRIKELLLLETKNVFLAERYAIGGLKTEAGTDRLIPLHDVVVPLLAKRIEPGQKYVLKGKVNPSMPYVTFNKEWRKRPLLAAHKTHDTRHTFISMLHSADIQEITIKLIVGHAQKDVTGQVYVHKALPELLEAVSKI